MSMSMSMFMFHVVYYACFLRCAACEKKFKVKFRGIIYTAAGAIKNQKNAIDVKGSFLS